MTSLTLDPMPRANDQAERELMELLTKKAEQVETNEDDTRTDHNQVYADPPDYQRTEFGRPQFSGAMTELHNDTRGGVTERLFDSRKPADAVHQQTVQQILDNGKAGRYETRSVHLRPKSMNKISHSPAQTLSERLRSMR